MVDVTVCVRTCDSNCLSVTAFRVPGGLHERNRTRSDCEVLAGAHSSTYPRGGFGWERGVKHENIFENWYSILVTN